MSTMIPYSPLKAIDRFGSLFEDVFGPNPTWIAGWNPAVDIKETKDAYIFQAELPGMNREDLDVELTGETLVISGKREEHHDETKEGFVRRERQYGMFKRMFRLEQPVAPDKIVAEYKDGVLNVTVPKTEAVKKHRISVKP